MFQFTGLSPLELWIHSRVLDESSGFPHSEISGSKFTYNSPKHIVVCHVLHRLLMPRHPLCALINLTFWYSTKVLLIDEFEILISTIASWLLKLLYYLIFKEQNLREIISQNQVKNQRVTCWKLFIYNMQAPKFPYGCFFYKSYSIERRWSIPTFS